MRIPFIRTTTDTADTLMLAVNGVPHVLDSNHPRFDEIASLAGEKVKREGLPAREQELLELINFAQTALDTMRSLSERVSVQGGTVFFDGDPIDGVLAEHILKMIKSGDDTWQAPVAFLENLNQNPAKHVRKRLFEWISDRGLTLTREGNVIGYKAVQNQGTNLSVTSGKNVVFVDGVEHTGHIPNPIGSTVTMARSAVNNDRDAGCEQGLHVGTFSYASHFSYFGPLVLTVEFNPRDVVAIPRDEGFAKIRTCRYKVLKVSESTAYQGTTWQDADDDDESYACEDCSGEGMDDDGLNCEQCNGAGVV